MPPLDGTALRLALGLAVLAGWVALALWLAWHTPAGEPDTGRWGKWE